MSKQKEAKGTRRREFLRLAGLGTVAGAASAAAAGTPRKAEAASPGTKTGSGYQETEHVKKVYDLSRF